MEALPLLVFLQKGAPSAAELLCVHRELTWNQLGGDRKALKRERIGTWTKARKPQSPPGTRCSLAEAAAYAAICSPGGLSGATGSRRTLGQQQNTGTWST